MSENIGEERALLISDQDHAHLMRLSLSERQRLLGLCAELSLRGYSAHLSLPYPHPSPAQSAPSGWAKVASVGDEPLGPDQLSWWWRPLAEGVRLQRALEPPTSLEQPEGLLELAPLSKLIRSPEQATLRRLLLTEGPQVTFIDAPWGSGLSWGLALAVADRLSEEEGELLMITPQPAELKRLVSALNPAVNDRLHVARFEEVYQRCFSEAPTPRSCSLERFSSQVEELSLSLPEHPWAQLLPLLKLLWELPEAREVALSALSPLWRESATELFKRLDESLLSPPAQASPPPEEWPWLHLSCVVIDDALLAPHEALERLLRLAHKTLSDKRRGWRLALAGRELGYPASLSVTWADLERLCVDELGAVPLKHHLTQSERLTSSRLSLMRAVGELDPRPWVTRPRRQDHLRLSHKPPHFSARSKVGLCLLKEELNAEERGSLLQSLQGSPGGLVIDLSYQGQLRAQVIHDDPARAVVRSREALLSPEVVSLGEASPLVFYLPDGLICSPLQSAPLPQALQSLVTSLEVQVMRYLLSRTGGEICFVGRLSAPIMSVLQASHDCEHIEGLNGLLERLDAQSPWGGSWAFRARAEARALMGARDWAGALTRWRSVLSVSALVFSEDGHQEALSSLVTLHSAALTESLKARAWKQAAALYLSSPSKPKPTLDEDQALILRVGVQELKAEAHEAYLKGDLSRFSLALSRLDGLGELEVAAALYDELVERLCQWSAEHLLTPVPQGPLQVAIMSFLSTQEPRDVVLQSLLSAYEQQPTAEALCTLAEAILKQPSSARQRWGCRHLLRWGKHLDRGLSELISAPALSFEHELSSDQALGEAQLLTSLSLLFATFAAREGAWVPAQRMSHMALSSELLGGHEPSASSRALKGPLASIFSAFEEAWGRQGLQERRRTLRSLGDLKGLEESYQEGHPPLNLSAAFELRKALERARGLWHSLTPAERAQLNRAWESVQLASPNPKWGLDALHPLDEALDPEEGEGPS